MATRWCSRCGSEFVDEVEDCPDCGIPVIGGEGPDPAAPKPPEVEGSIAYELHTWASESRAMLDRLLVGEGIPRAWEGTDLVVPAFLEERVDELVEQVTATTETTLDPDAEQILLELSDWDDAHAEALAARLDEEGIPYEFDLEGNLAVLAEDEERVDAVVEAVEFPDALVLEETGGDDDGLPETAVMLSDLFVASDRLRNHARDYEGVLGLVEAAVPLAEMELPFGFDPKVWEDLVSRTTSLREALEGDGSSDEEIEAAADELREILHRFV